MDEIIKLYQLHLDHSLLERNLKLTVDERFRQLMEMQKFASEIRRAGIEAANKTP